MALAQANDKVQNQNEDKETFRAKASSAASER
jgi:hypothetical protein